MTNTDIKYIINRMSAIVSTGIDLLFWAAPGDSVESMQVCERVNALLEAIQQDLRNLEQLA